MAILDTLNEDMKAALRAGEKLELGALRLAVAAVKKQAIDAQCTLDDPAVIGILQKLIRQGREAAEQFEKAGRTELATKEAAEIAVFERYLPQALDASELEALIRGAIESTGASGPADMGKVMGRVKAEAAGRADMAAVSARVRELLTG